MRKITETRVPKAFRLPQKLVEEFREKCEKEGRLQGQVVQKLIDMWVRDKVRF